MYNAEELLNIIKKASMDAYEASQPSDFCFGKVIQTSPLKISVEQKMTLGAAQLVLTRNVTDYSTKITVDWKTTSEEDHSHSVKGEKTITVHNGLKKGDEVILLKRKGGQKFLVLDRVVNT